MPELPEVQLPPINGKVITVGLVSDDYDIGGAKNGKNIVNVYDSRFIEYISEMAKNRVYRKFDCPILISGPRRTGKSTTAISIARALNPKFSSDLIAFRLEDFVEVLNRLPPADPDRGFFPVAILDESGVDLYSKDWQHTLVKQMVKVFQIIGMKKLTMILCLPHRNFLTKDIRESMYLWVVTQEDMDGERGFAELREGIYNKWMLSLYWKPICGFCYDPIGDDFWKSYEKRKVEFIDEFAQTEHIPDASHAGKVMAQRNKLIRFIISEKKKLGVNEESLGKMIDMHKMYVSKVVCQKKK